MGKKKKTKEIDTKRGYSSYLVSSLISVVVGILIGSKLNITYNTKYLELFTNVSQYIIELFFRIYNGATFPIVLLVSVLIFRQAIIDILNRIEVFKGFGTEIKLFQKEIDSFYEQNTINNSIKTSISKEQISDDKEIVETESVGEETNKDLENEADKTKRSNSVIKEHHSASAINQSRFGHGKISDYDTSFVQGIGLVHFNSDVIINNDAILSSLNDLAITMGEEGSTEPSISYSYEMLETYIIQKLRSIKNSNYNKGKGQFTPIELESEVVNEFNLPVDLSLRIRKARELRNNAKHLRDITGKRNVDMGDFTYLKYNKSIKQIIAEIDYYSKKTNKETVMNP
ncbi:hypothetical protein JZO79_12045 [Vagococcus fluvialis]|uniref:hypothetical protein n=1 Tax=Vagococcus fluvialis TaxID=2738 RepID=UPI001A8FB73B|nr:hypothetical protein [Vagococcus fluvialis]MBO0444346.1 hypothetical protein [Vagococcus fluvialis]